MAIGATPFVFGILSLGLGLLGAPGTSAMAAQDSASMSETTTKLLGELNGPLNRVNEQNRSYQGLFDAYIDMTQPPMPVGDDFNQTTVWSGMYDWSAVSDWAEANADMAKALKGAQSKLLLGLPYGEESVPQSYRDAGVYVGIQLDSSAGELVSLKYLQAMETIATWSVAEQYRLCEAGSFDDAFSLGIASARVLRQLCDRQMLGEKFTSFRLLGEAMSVQRDLMMHYIDQIPVELFRKFATKEYPFLKPSDNERLRRLELPEGDRLVTAAVLTLVFDEDGDPVPDQLAMVFGSMQAEDAPLTRFGAIKRWEALAAVHGSMTASQEKLTDVYDDWWRRWRLRQYDPIQQLPTEFSRINEVRYAAVVQSIADMKGLFAERNRLIVEIDGTVLAAGLCGYYRKHDNWPKDREMAYVTFIPKRFDFDPYDKDYGRLLFRYLGSRKEAIDSEYGRVYATGCLLYARGSDNEDENGRVHDPDGTETDFVIWPPLRELARQQELID